MPKRTFISAALVLAIFALSSSRAAACGWSGCDYEAPVYGYYAPPVYAYYLPPVYYAPPPVYAYYAPPIYGYAYNQPYATGYYGRRGYVSAPYYSRRVGYVAAP
jgi:hypothetical protein